MKCPIGSKGNKPTFIIAVAFSVLIGGTFWWYITRKLQREAFCHGVMNSDLDEVDKKIIGQLALDPHAWKSGLMEKIVGDNWMKRVVWESGELEIQGERVRIVLFDTFIRPVGSKAFPLICAVLDKDYHLLTWLQVAPWSFGFLEARITSKNREQVVMRVVTRVSYGQGPPGSYEYEIAGHSIARIDSDGRELAHPSTASGSAVDPPQFPRDPRNMEEILRTLRLSSPRKIGFPRLSGSGYAIARNELARKR